MKSALVMACSVLLSVTSLHCGAQHVNPAKTPHEPNENLALSKPAVWRASEQHLFADSKIVVVFTLATSWIPGEDHKGLFRYKLHAAPRMSFQDIADNPELSSREGIETFVKRVSDCSITLRLNDRDGFLLRTVPLNFNLEVGEDTKVQALSANDATQMDAAEYKMFAGDGTTSGTYGIGWKCVP